MIKHSSLDENSCVDVFTLDGWLTVRVDQLVQVNSKDVILCLWPNLRMSLSVADTPGLEHLVSLQGWIIQSCTKHRGSESVSPTKLKVQRVDPTLPPLPSFLTLVDDPVAVQEVQVASPTQKQPSMPQPTLVAQDPQFSGRHPAHFIISGLNKLNRTKGEGSVGDWYKQIFGCPTYPHVTLSKMQERLELAHQIFNALSPKQCIDITWGALLQMVAPRDNQAWDNFLVIITHQLTLHTKNCSWPQ